MKGIRTENVWEMAIKDITKISICDCHSVIIGLYHVHW